MPAGIDDRTSLLETAAQQTQDVQRLACVAACERVYPLVNRLGSDKSRFVCRYATEELWMSLLFPEWRERTFLELVRTLPETSAWNTKEAAYYAMSGISVVEHTRVFFEEGSRESLEYVLGTAFDLAVEYEAGLGDAEVENQRRVYEGAGVLAVRAESMRAAMGYRRGIDRFCVLMGW